MQPPAGQAAAASASSSTAPSANAAVLVLCGLPAAGKTTVATTLAAVSQAFRTLQGVPVRVEHVSFDALLAEALTLSSVSTPSDASPAEQFNAQSWKDSRSAALQRIATLLRDHHQLGAPGNPTARDREAPGCHCDRNKEAPGNPTVRDKEVSSPVQSASLDDHRQVEAPADAICTSQPPTHHEVPQYPQALTADVGCDAQNEQPGFAPARQLPVENVDAGKTAAAAVTTSTDRGPAGAAKSAPAASVTSNMASPPRTADTHSLAGAAAAAGNVKSSGQLCTRVSLPSPASPVPSSLFPPPAPQPRSLSSPPERLLVIADDNFQYRSMRHECLQLARQYRAAFLQLYIECPVDVALQRNAARPAGQRVPEASLRRMHDVMEPPRPGTTAWEQHALVLSCHDEILADGPALWSLLAARWGPPCEPPADVAALLLQRQAEGWAANSASAVHTLDVWSRKLVSEAVAAVKQECRRALAAELNDRRRSMLAACRSLFDDPADDDDTQQRRAAAVAALEQEFARLCEAGWRSSET